MSSEESIMILEGVSKCFYTYAHPRDRLKQFIFPHLQALVGSPVRSYAKEFWALQDISLTIRRGEAIGIIGKNGSGKSTLLQIITGVLAPTTGKVEVHGRVAALLELGSGFNPEFTGRENVFLNGTLLGFSRKEIAERFDQIAGFADIGDFIDQPVKTYSSGMFVRLAFAVQVQLDPDILIVDEALAVGDALFQKRCYQRLERFLSNGGTLLFVSHDQEIVRTLTHRAIFLNQGKCRAIGTSSDIVLEYRRHLHEEEFAYAQRTHTEHLKAPSSQGVSTNAAAPNINNEEGVLKNRLSFGDFDAQIIEVKVSVNGDPNQTTAYPDDMVLIRMRCVILKDLTHLSFGFLLRNREGIKVYAGGSFADDVNQAQIDPERQGIWHHQFKAGEEVDVCMQFKVALGQGFYEIQAYICEEQMFVPGFQRMLHWRDEAAFFTVAMDRLKRWYGGICDIGVRYELRADNEGA